MWTLLRVEFITEGRSQRPNVVEFDLVSMTNDLAMLLVRFVSVVYLKHKAHYCNLLMYKNKEKINLSLLCMGLLFDYGMESFRCH